MPVKIIEKRLVLAFTCFIAAIVVVLNIFPSTPMRISERSIMLVVAAIILTGAGIGFFMRSVVKI